jgi:hypothetical protein
LLFDIYLHISLLLTTLVPFFVYPMSFLPVTPKKLRPFRPLISPRKRSLSPPPDINIGFNSTPLPSSSGMLLLIRNVIPNNKTGFAKPVELVREAVHEIFTTDAGKDLVDISVLVVPGGRPLDPHSSSAYLKLSQDVKLLDSVPRPDLLADWKIALLNARPTWDVVWAPQKKGKDRLMIV